MSRKAGEGNMASYVDYLNNYDRKARGAGSSKGTDRFSGLDIRHAHDAAKDFGVNKYDAADQVLQYARTNEDNTKMGGAAEDALDNLREMLKDRPEPETGTDPGTNPGTDTPTQEPGQGGGGQKTKDVTGGDYGITSPISQDNDIGIDGNNNRVNQDNSINQTIDSRDQSDNRRYYGGSSRVFNYRGGDGESKLYDSPVSMATMGGFYDTDDSPAAAAKFMDMYVDSNILGQRDIRRDYDKRKITDYGANDPGRMTELEGRLGKSIKGSRSRSDKQERKMFGDNPYGGTFKLPQLPNPVVDNTQQIYEDAIDRIKKI
tara:strand:+ start:886 stop:1836 length:951 start_codon:yes stop_codon:yes gene_type:complete